MLSTYDVRYVYVYTVDIGYLYVRPGINLHFQLSAKPIFEAGKLGYLCVLASHNLCYKVILSVYDVKIVLC